MRSFLSRAAIIAALSIVPALVQAAAPAAPVVTVGAGFKQLRFDFEPVSGASYYQLWFRANGGAAWVKYMENTAATTEFDVTVSAHLLDWFNARYYVTACNSSGCSRTSDIYVTSLMRDTVGYFKPRAGVIEAHWYGQQPALSADGTTYAVLEGETRGTRQDSASVMVYRKGSTGWRQEARLEASPVEEQTAFPLSARQLAINGDGTVIVLGLPYQYTPGPGSDREGAAFVYRRGSTGWTLEQKITQNTRPSWLYGESVDIDDAGETIVIQRRYAEDPVNYWATAGMVEIWRHDTSGWTRQGTAPATEDHQDCAGVALSGDGKILARTCSGYAQVYEQTATGFEMRASLSTGSNLPYVDATYDGSVIVIATGSVPPAGARYLPYVTVYRRNGSDWLADPGFTYVGGHTTKPPSNRYYGGHVAISADGRFVAVGSPGDENAGSGVVHGPLTRTSDYIGAVFVFERKPDVWALRNMIKPNSAATGTDFGWGVAFGDNGKILVVGAPYEDSGARGIDGDQTDTSSPDSGAGWIY